MSKETDIGYEFKQSLPNKLIKEDGSITDFAGNPVVAPVEAYNSKPALPNKWLNPDGSYSTLNEIVSSLLDSEIFIIVDELPETGVSNKIYLLVQDNSLIEYLWVNNAWDPVGMVEFDINNYYTKTEVTSLIAACLTSAKAYTDQKISEISGGEQIYFSNMQIPYNQQRTYTNSAYLDVFNEAVKNSQYSMQMIYVTTSYGSNAVPIKIMKGSIDTSQNSVTVYTERVFYNEFLNSYTKINSSRGFELTLNFTNGVITSIVTKASTSVTSGLAILMTDSNYSVPYTPLYAGSPATKKYVDDSITTNITNALNESY